MEGGNLDIYSAEFKRLAQLAEYNLEERLVGRKYFDGLPEGHLSSYMTCCSVITIRVLIIDTGRVSA
jgi:hypothetical protein